VINWRQDEGSSRKDADVPSVFDAIGLSLVSAILGGYGVFCANYSFTAPEIAAKALVLLGAALSISYFTRR
jgi:hypothetical protein